MSQEYKEKCRDCGNEIIMSNQDWKWMDLETDGIMLHACKRSSGAKAKTKAKVSH